MGKLQWYTQSPKREVHSRLPDHSRKNSRQTFYGESLANIVQTPNNKLFAYEKVAITGWASTPKEDIQEVVDFFVRNGYKEKVLDLKQS